MGSRRRKSRHRRRPVEGDAPEHKENPKLRRLRRRIRKQLPGVTILLAVIIGGSIGAYFYLNRGTEELGEEGIDPSRTVSVKGFEPYSVPHDDPETLEELLENHRAAIGTPDQASISNQRITGTIELNTGSARFSVIKEHPLRYRITITEGAPRRSVAYNGERAWERVGDRYQKLSLEETSNLHKDAGIFDPLVDPEVYGATLEWKGQEEIDGTRFNVVVVSYADGSSESFYLDRATHLTRYRYRLAWLRDQWMEQMTRYLQYRRHAGYAVAMRYEDFINGEFFGTTLYEDMEYDMGLMIDMFKVPDELLQAGS